MEKFRTIDINNDGFISAKELINLLTTVTNKYKFRFFLLFQDLYKIIQTGEEITKHELKIIIDEADLDNNGKLNYHDVILKRFHKRNKKFSYSYYFFKFSKLILETVDKSKNLAKKRMEKISNI